ncbi:MAG TPA: GDSL-type esterase/lipase family protein [Parvibaculum sp.]|jgi:lysophospholipase L1-like esterase
MSFRYWSGRLFPALALAGLIVAAVFAAAPSFTHRAPALVEAPFFVQPARMAEKHIRAASAPVDLVFIGDSITQNYESYKPVWDAFYGRRNALNLGYGMDTTGATLWRIAQGELDGLTPKAAVILIGTNNTNLGRGVVETVAGVEAVVDAVRTRSPRTMILLLGILPSGKSAAKSRADAEINARLAGVYAKSGIVTFLDIAPAFVKNGALDLSLYVEQSPAGALHPNARGQAAMATAIEPALARLLGERAKSLP